jgi:HAD superfamily hydrolase (TIGR01509 family)
MQAILNYELQNGIPPGWINHSISSSSRTPSGSWARLERGEVPLSPSFFSGFSSDLHNTNLWSDFYTKKARISNPSLPSTIPPLPKIDAEKLFWTMMDESRHFDPWMYPALLNLKQSGKFILAALSNTVIFPSSHPYSKPPPESDIRLLFSTFISSAHIGLRKPDPTIYALALQKCNEVSKAQGKGMVEAGDILFFDDIGENLKAAKEFGMRTVKVRLGKTFEAVDELERVTGLRLAGDEPRVPVEVKGGGRKAKL